MVDQAEYKAVLDKVVRYEIRELGENAVLRSTVGNDEAREHTIHLPVSPMIEI